VSPGARPRGESIVRRLRIDNTKIATATTVATEPMKYPVVIEKGPNNYAAYVPDLPVCVATGKTRGEVDRNTREAIELRLEGMREGGLPIPGPRASAAVQ